MPQGYCKRHPQSRDCKPIVVPAPKPLPKATDPPMIASAGLGEFSRETLAWALVCVFFVAWLGRRDVMTPEAELKRSNSYRQAIGLLRQLARLAERGRSQTPDARPLRQALDAIWSDMSSDEQDLVEAMSADLWTLMDIGPLGPEPPTDAQQVYKDAVAVQNWQIVSICLRDYPRLATGSQGALRRSECWAALGEDAIASEFAEHAGKLLRAQQATTAASDSAQSAIYAVPWGTNSDERNAEYESAGTYCTGLPAVGKKCHICGKLHRIDLNIGFDKAAADQVALILPANSDERGTDKT